MSYEGKRKVLCLILEKSLCGAVTASICWYELPINTLTDDGYKINPCDSCVANKNAQVKQITIMWHGDDAKMSHANPVVFDEITNLLEIHFGKMKVTRGKMHQLLGIKIACK